MKKIYTIHDNQICEYNILKELKKGYITDIEDGHNVRIIDKKGIDKSYYFLSKEKAVLSKIKEKEKYIEESQKDIQILKKYLYGFPTV